MTEMRFDTRDIFRSPRYALSLQRIWIQFLGLLTGYFGYLILTYLSFIVAGVGLVKAWKKYGLLPCLFPESPNWYSLIVYFIGVIWLVCVYLIAATALSRATYKLLKNDHFYTWLDAVKFSLKRAGSVIASPVSIAIMVLFILAGGAVVGLLGKIPFVGEFGITLFTVIWFFASLLVVFIIIVLAVALIETPAIIATTEDDAFEAVFQSFSLLWSQPWRFLWYTLVSAALAILGLLIAAALSKQAYVVMERVFSFAMGANFINVSSHAMYLLNVWLFHSILWAKSLLNGLVGWFYFSKDFIPLPLPHGYQFVASYIFAIWMLMIGLVVVSYGLASFNVGTTIGYLVLRKTKDGDNLLERKDSEEEKEEEQQPSTETQPSSEASVSTEQTAGAPAEGPKKERKRKSKESES